MATYKGVVPSTKYSFNATLGQITFDSDYTGIALSDIMLITNVKSGTAVTIYDPFDPAKGGILAGLILTLTYSTAGMLNSDPLQIIVGMTSLPTALPTGASTETTLSTLNGKIPSGLTVSSTRLLVDGAGGTFPISGSITVSSGTVTANAGTNLNTSALALESGGNLATIKSNTDNLALAQGSTTSGQKGNLAMASVSSSAPAPITGTTQPLSLNTSGELRVGNDGTTVYRAVSANSNNLFNIKAGAGKVYGWYIFNSANIIKKILLYDATTVTFGQIGVLAPLFSLIIPPSSGANVSFTNAVNFTNGLWIATVGGGTPANTLLDSDNTIVNAGDLSYNIIYK